MITEVRLRSPRHKNSERLQNRCSTTRASLLPGDAGQTLVPVVIFMAVAMFGLLAFALDVGYIFHEKRMAQAAADAAAIAAAEEFNYNGNISGSDVTNAADAAAAANGFNPNATINPAQVTVSTSSSGNYSASGGSGGVPSTWVNVKVSRSVPTFFMAAFRPGFRSMAVSATASAAGAQTSPTCVCMEGMTGNDLTIENGSSMTENNCGIGVNSSSSNAITIAGNSQLCAESVAAAASGWDSSSNITGGSSVCSSAQVVQGNYSCSPNMPTPPTDTSCSGDPTQGGSWGATPSYSGKLTVGPNSGLGSTINGDTICYTSMNINENGTTDSLNPGIYVINGGTLHFWSGTNGGGNGVFFYLENGATLQIDNGADVNLVAGGNAENGGGTTPSVGTSGEYNGILIYQDSSDSNTLNFGGGSTTYFNGALYAPSAAINIDNGSGATIKSDIVGQTLTDTGGSQMVGYPITSLGSNNVSVAKLTQ